MVIIHKKIFYMLVFQIFDKQIQIIIKFGTVKIINR